MRVAGVDGTKGGWVAVMLEGGRVAADALLHIDTEFTELADVDVIGIDVPIGFGPRAADAAAREYLGRAAASVFPVPSRASLEAPYRPGLSFSKQAYALGPRIIHITDLAASDSRLVEVHPEVSFKAMNDGQPLRYRKKAYGGVMERMRLLRRHGIEPPQQLTEAAVAPIDDVLDAAAAAWSARRIATRQAQSLPDPPQLIDGALVAIWY